jgi:hypothetical protein
MGVGWVVDLARSEIGGTEVDVILVFSSSDSPPERSFQRHHQEHGRTLAVCLVRAVVTTISRSL